MVCELITESNNTSFQKSKQSILKWSIRIKIRPTKLFIVYKSVIQMKSTTKESSTASGNDIKFFELEKAKFIIKDATNLDVAYAYEDLVFSEHGIFILQFHKQLLL